MLRYIIKRMLFLIPVMLGATLLVFSLLYFLPGSAVSRMASSGNGDLLDTIFKTSGGWGQLFNKVYPLLLERLYQGGFRKLQYLS